MSEDFDEERLPPYAVRSAEEDELRAALDSGDDLRIGAIRGLIAWRDAQFEAKPVPDKAMFFQDDGTLLFEGDLPQVVAPITQWTDEEWAARQAQLARQRAGDWS